MRPLLEIQDLVVGFETPRGFMRAVDGVGLSIGRGEVVGLVGESGCGKSATAFSILRLLPYPTGRIASGSIRFFAGKEALELTALDEKSLCAIRGRQIAMIFQEPMSALNPVMRVGDQVAEGLILHEKISKPEAVQEALRLLKRVGIVNADLRLRAYPHELSGGERQRVAIAMALVCKPSLVIADEPTTALDVTLQAQILELLRELQRETDASILFITHDLGLVKKFCDRTYVMYAGQIVESNVTSLLFGSPRHPYTHALLAARPGDANPPKTPLKSIEGRLPTFWEWESGCRFCSRCSFCQSKCKAAQKMEMIATSCVRCCRHSEFGKELQ